MPVREVEVEGNRLHLLPGRGIYVPEYQTLLVADTHLGKEATFRKSHIPVPRGATENTLNRLERMLVTTQAKRLIILGDLIHAGSSLTREVIQALDAFFAARREVEFVLRRGNRDVGLSKLSSGWPLDLQHRYQLGNMLLAHRPRTEIPANHLICCGHLHPAIRVARGSERLGKLPCFWLSNRCLVLPAVGEFTGTLSVQPDRQDKMWMIAEGHVLESSMPCSRV